MTSNSKNLAVLADKLIEVISFFKVGDIEEPFKEKEGTRFKKAVKKVREKLEPLNIN